MKTQGPGDELCEHQGMPFSVAPCAVPPNCLSMESNKQSTGTPCVADVLIYSVLCSKTEG